MSYNKTPKKKGNINRYGHGVTIYSKTDDIWWWVPSCKKWMKHDEVPLDKDRSSHYNSCRTLRAFERHVRKNCAHIKDAEIVWCQRHGSDAIIEV